MKRKHLIIEPVNHRGGFKQSLDTLVGYLEKGWELIMTIGQNRDIYIIAEPLDVTLTGHSNPAGALHLTQDLIDEMAKRETIPTQKQKIRRFAELTTLVATNNIDEFTILGGQDIIPKLNTLEASDWPVDELREWKELHDELLGE